MGIKLIDRITDASSLPMVGDYKIKAIIIIGYIIYICKKTVPLKDGTPSRKKRTACTYAAQCICHVYL